jgi:hypothetical protein
MHAYKSQMEIHGPAWSSNDITKATYKKGRSHSKINSYGKQIFWLCQPPRLLPKAVLSARRSSKGCEQNPGAQCRPG